MPLILNGKNVNKISGPVSMYILTPKKSKLFPNLPVFMLFGDIHLGEEGMCVEKENKGAYSIYDLQFLSMLSNLTRPEEPIDFYVEGGDFHNTKCTKPYCKDYPMSRIWNLYGECYSKKKLALYRHNTNCAQIKNIRWQSADPRHFRILSNYKVSCSIYKLLKSINFDVEYSKRSSELLTSSSEFFRTNKACKNILLQDTKYPNNNADEELLSFINIILDQDGLVYKQLSKIDWKQRSVIIEFIKEHCNHIFRQNLQKFDINLETIQYIHSQLLIYIKKGVRDQKFFDTYLADHWESLRLYRYYNVIKYGTMLDIYTICRCFKYLDYKGASPIMNIIYCGNLHLENITFFLEKITKLYTCKIIQKGSSDSNNPNRCVEIKPHLDLKTILDELRHTRVYSSLKLDVNKSASSKTYPSPKKNSAKPAKKKTPAKKKSPIKKKTPAKKTSASRKKSPPKKTSASRKKSPPKKTSANRKKSSVNRKKTPAKKTSASRKKTPKNTPAKKKPAKKTSAKRKSPNKVAKRKR